MKVLVENEIFIFYRKSSIKTIMLSGEWFKDPAHHAAN